MLTHHVAKTWSFLKGHGRAVHMSPSPAAAAAAAAAAPLWLTDGFHLVKVFKPSSCDTRVNPGSSSEWRSCSGAELWRICGLSALARDQNLPWHVTARCRLHGCSSSLYFNFLILFFLLSLLGWWHSGLVSAIVRGIAPQIHWNKKKRWIQNDKSKEHTCSKLWIILGVFCNTTSHLTDTLHKWNPH